jgi:hypothetical protein
MTSIGKKFMFHSRDTSDDSDDDDKEAIIDEDIDEEEDAHIVCAASPPPAAAIKKKNNRMSASKRKYLKNLKTLVQSAKAAADDSAVDLLCMEWIERNPPSKKRKRDEEDDDEENKPKKYTAYLMFLKTNMATAKHIEPKQRMSFVSKKWELADKEERDRYQALAEQENLRLDPNYQPSAPKEKKVTSDPLLAWMKERLSKMPQYQNTSKKDLHKIAKEELKKPENVEEFKRT